ncbi:MAG: helix-turn-helix domain-containing protein [Thermomicrobiales bacterium]
MVSAGVANGLITATDEERADLARLEDAIGAGAGTGPRLVGADGAEIVLPESVRLVLAQAVAALAHDQAVAVLPVDKALTTQRAADLLNVSRPHLVKLLDEGAIPHFMSGTHRRVRLDDLLAHRRARDAERREILRRMTEEGQEFESLLDGADLKRLGEFEDGDPHGIDAFVEHLLADSPQAPTSAAP